MHIGSLAELKIMVVGLIEFCPRSLMNIPPKNKEEWLQCVKHAHVKNEMIQSYGHTPHQTVFGRNPRVPSDLLDEPLHVVSATASLHDSAAETCPGDSKHCPESRPRFAGQQGS